MTYKTKSLIYLFAFIIASLLYYNMEPGQDGQTENSPEVVTHSSISDSQASLTH